MVIMLFWQLSVMYSIFRYGDSEVLVVMQMEYARVNKSLQVSCNSSNFVRIAIYHLSILIIQCDVKTVWKLIIKINF